MSSTPPAESVPPIEPQPVVEPAGSVPPPPAPPVAPPAVDPYAAMPTAQPASPAYAPAYQGAYYGAPQPPKGLAIASMVTGIASIVFSIYGFGILPSIAAIITGNLARKRQPYARGFWLAGLICGYIGLAFAVLWIAGIIIFIIFVAANPSYNSGDYQLN